MYRKRIQWFNDKRLRENIYQKTPPKTKKQSKQKTPTGDLGIDAIRWRLWHHISNMSKNRGHLDNFNKEIKYLNKNVLEISKFEPIFKR